MKPKIGDTVQFKKSGITGTVEKILRGSYVVKTPTSKLSAWPEDLIIVGLSEISLDKEMDEHQKLCDEIMAIQGIEPIEAEIEEVWHCPDGYIFKDENGNVINATKIVLEKKKNGYPKTYEECCEIVKVGKEHTLEGATIRINYKIALLESFQKLLICRDAYWKIAGEEMGLNRPWEPYYKIPELDLYVIINIYNRVEKAKYEYGFQSCVFTIPTEEMRDAFKEIFDKDLEFCKELL